MAKKLLISCAAVITLLVVAIIAFQQFYDFSSWKERLVLEFTSQTGYPTSTDGEMELKFRPRPVFIIYDVKIANLKWAKEPDFISVERIEFQPSLRSMIAGKVQISAINIFGLWANLETDGDGGDNWHPRIETSIDESVIKSNAALTPLNLSINDIKIRFRSGLVLREQIYNIDTVTVRLSEVDAPIEIIAATSLDDLPIRLRGSLGALSNYLVNQPAKIDLNGNFGNAQLSLIGAIEEPKTLTGAALNFVFDAKSLDEFGRLDLGPLGDYFLPKGEPLRVSARVRSGLYGPRIDNVVARIGNVILR